MKSPPNRESGIGQISPKIVEVVGFGSVVEACSAKNPEIVESVRLPECHSAARTRSVVHKRDIVRRTKLRRIVTGLIDIDRSLPGDPLAGAALIFPNVVQESRALGKRGTISPAAKEPEVAGGIRPAPSTPARARNVGSCGSLLRSIDAVLVGHVAARDPGPLRGGYVEFPQVIQESKVDAVGVESLPPENPHVAR